MRKTCLRAFEHCYYCIFNLDSVLRAISLRGHRALPLALMMIVALLILALTCGHLAGADVGTKPTNLPNVLFIVSDDLRAEIDAPGFSCGTGCWTPNLFSLASMPGATSFKRAYVQQALCAPSRNSFLTGRRPDSTKSWNFIDSFRERGIGGNWTSLPQYFKEKGYTVVGTGKVFHKGLPPNWDMPRSWDDRMGTEWKGWLYPSESRCPNGTVWCAVKESGDATEFEDTQITQRALELHANVSKMDSPWFLAVGYRKPHVQWKFPSRFLDAIPIKDVTTPRHGIFPHGADEIAFHQPVDDFLKPFSDVVECGGVEANTPFSKFSRECQLHFRRAYHASVAFMDSQIGILIHHLKVAGDMNNTVVVVLGDHGWHLGEGAMWEKFTNFELAARTPLIIRAPLQIAKRDHALVSNQLVELIDVYPTLTDLIFDDVRPSLEGKSLCSIIVSGSRRVPLKNVSLSQFPRCVTDKKNPWKNNDCSDVPRSDFTHMGYSIRTASFRYTKWFGWNGDKLKPDINSVHGIELYDHRKDDGRYVDMRFEHENVAKQYPKIVETMDALLVQNMS